MVHQLARIEAVRSIGVGRLANVGDVEDVAITLVLVVGGANLEELALFPLGLADLEARAVGPDDGAGGAAGVAKTAGVEGLVVARRSPVAFGEQGEEIDGLVAGNEIAQAQDRRLFAGHVGDSSTL